jgi:hypothetical protein
MRVEAFIPIAIGIDFSLPRRHAGLVRFFSSKEKK